MNKYKRNDIHKFCDYVYEICGQAFIEILNNEIIRDEHLNSEIKQINSRIAVVCLNTTYKNKISREVRDNFYNLIKNKDFKLEIAVLDNDSALLEATQCLIRLLNSDLKKNKSNVRLMINPTKIVCHFDKDELFSSDLVQLRRFDNNV